METSMPDTAQPMVLYYCLKHGRTAQRQCCGRFNRPLYFCPFCGAQFARKLDTCANCGQRAFRKQLKLAK